MFGNSTVASLVGVIDLQCGQCVRAAGGDRAAYQPVSWFSDSSGLRRKVDGDATVLVNGYRSAGIQTLYIADLDALQGSAVQENALGRIFHAAHSLSVFVDLGLTRATLTPFLRGVHREFRGHPIRWVVATETAEDPELLSMLIEHLTVDELAVSFDFRQGEFLSMSADLDAWIEASHRVGVNAVITLDLAAVGGTDLFKTESICRTIRQGLPDVALICGGGVRDEEDAERLRDAGANKILVASAFCG